MKFNKYFSYAFCFLGVCFASCSEEAITTEAEEQSEIPVPTERPVAIEEEAFAFPGAEGFGRNATGGRGGKVMFVTNLNDSGEGSFRAALEASGSRYVLFQISGTIELKSKLVIRNSNITIAGQTAPGGGITIKDYPVVVDADNVIIRFMRFRMGDEAEQQADALEGRFHKNIIVDHCSFSWSTDETVTFYGNENTTIQWSFITESLRTSIHEKGTHGYGGIWGGRNASFHHNLLAHHDSRNPRLGEVAGEAFALTDLVDLRNNVIYNWKGNSTYGGEGMNVNIINSYYKPGPATTKNTRIIAIDKNTTEGSAIYDIWGKFYIDGNVVEGNHQVTENNWDYGVFNQFHNKYGEVSDAEKEAIKLEEPHSINDNVTTHTAEVAYDKVLDIGGASFSRDMVDIRIVENVRNTSYDFEGSMGSSLGLIDSQADVGGWPELETEDAPFDSSKDGMPDAWKKAQLLDVQKFQANAHDLSTGYENIEVYINSLVEKIIEQQY